jgi:hypothetical protein
MHKENIMSQRQVKKYKRTIHKKRIELILEFLDAIKQYPLSQRIKFAWQIVLAKKGKAK